MLCKYCRYLYKYDMHVYRCIISDQQRHEELVQVDYLDAAQTHRDLPVHPRRVRVTVPLRRPRKQGEFEAEHLLAHDGHRLQGEEEEGGGRTRGGRGEVRKNEVSIISYKALMNNNEYRTAQRRQYNMRS